MPDGRSDCLKRVAFLIHFLRNGGAERVISNLSLNLPDNINRSIILYDASDITYQYGGNLIDLNLRGSDNLWGKLAGAAMRIGKLHKIKKKCTFTSVISFTENPNLMNLLTRRKEKVIISVRNYLSKETGKKGIAGFCYRALVRLLYNRADLLIAVSKEVKKDLVENFKINCDKIKVIYNPYDIEGIQKKAEEDIEEELEAFFNGKTIVNVGRLTYQKGQWHLIRAFSYVKKKIPDAKLVIIGSGELKESLEELSCDLGLGNDVLFLGFKQNPHKYIKKSKVFVLSSFFEGFPNGLVEAMACGLPIISTDCKSGPREILAKDSDFSCKIKDRIEYAQHGILVPECDGQVRPAGETMTVEETLMAKSITACLSDDELCKNYSRLALERVKDFNMDSIIEQYVKVII